MGNKICFTLLCLVISAGIFAQQPLPGNRGIRVVDTLSVQEKASRNPVLLRAELDSIISLYIASQQPRVMAKPVTGSSTIQGDYVLAGLVTIIVLLGFFVYQFYRHQQKINRVIAGLKEKPGPVLPVNGHSGTGKERKGKFSPQSLENRISDLDAELHKLSRENEGLNRVIKEYNGIQHEYDSLKHGMLKTYKVKNYPGYDKSKNEHLAMQGVFATEHAVAAYAYEKFLKPVLAIADANKNSPAKISPADQEKVLDLLVSLSLLYIEYLYLRVNDLAIGGKMVERIQALSKGNGLDTSLLKKLNTEFGSRALVVKTALERASLHQLSYPVFDETNLNNL